MLLAISPDMLALTLMLLLDGEVSPHEAQWTYSGDQALHRNGGGGGVGSKWHSRSMGTALDLLRVQLEDEISGLDNPKDLIREAAVERRRHGADTASTRHSVAG